MNEPNPETHENPSHIRLETLLITLTFSTGKAIPDTVRSIDLGEIGLTAEEMLDRSLADPQGRERIRTVEVDYVRRLSIDSEDTIGTRTLAQPRPFRYQLLSTGQPDRHYAMEFHTHGPNNLPFSPDDVIGLFRPRNDIISPVSVLAITPERKMLGFRGKETPEWDQEKRKRMNEKWTREILDQIQRKTKPGMTRDQLDGIAGVVEHRFLRFLREHFDIQLFSCPAEENIAHRESA